MAQLLETLPVEQDNPLQENRPFIQRNTEKSFSVSNGKEIMVFELTPIDLTFLLNGERRIILQRR